jgi:hypothetical protein
LCSGSPLTLRCYGGNRHRPRRGMGPVAGDGVEAFDRLESRRAAADQLQVLSQLPPAQLPLSDALEPASAEVRGLNAPLGGTRTTPRYSPISTPNSTARCEVVCDKLLRAPENRARRQARLRRGVLSTRDRPRRRQRSSPARLKRKLVRRYCRPRIQPRSSTISATGCRQ